MTRFELVQEEIDRIYGGRLSDFMHDVDYNRSKLSFEVVEEVNLDEENPDSYGYENTTLKRILKFSDLEDLLVMVTGSRRSYAGEEWDEIKEVTKQTKTIEYYG